MEECRQCLNHDRIPGIRIKNGICCVCEAFGTIKDKLMYEELLEDIFAKTINRYRGKASFDAVIGLSGGKDSSYALLELVRSYGLRIKAVTFQNTFLTETAEENIERLVEKLKVAHEYISFPEDYLKGTYERSVQKTGAPCLGCSFAMYAAIHDYAKKHAIPMIFHGRSRGQMLGRYGAQEKSPFQTMYADDKDYRDMVKQYYPQFFTDTAVPYIGYYMYHKVSDEEMIRELTRETGWRYAEKEGHRVRHFDCSFHEKAEAMFYERNGYRQDLAEINYMIRMGQLTREEGLERIRQRGL